MLLIYFINNYLNPKDKVEQYLTKSKKILYFVFALDVEILYDSSIDFNERLYLKLGVDLTHIKLRRTLRDIVSQPLIFIRDILAKETFEALDKLHKVR
jgi:hypothetical protein